jgi:hypothetical protein
MNLLGQYQNRDRGDPQYVHHPADEEQCHQRPATTDAVAAMANTERECAARVGTKSAVALNKPPGRLALPQTGVLERRPLI